jgi:hypothetical protein
MRLFWSIVGGLIVLALAVSLSGRSRSLESSGTPIAPTRATEPAPADPAPNEIPALAPSGPVTPTAPEPKPVEGASLAEALVGPPEPTDQDRSPDADPLGALAATASNRPEAKPSKADADTGARQDPAALSGAPGELKPFEWPDDPAFGPDKYVESKAVLRPDGAILLDDRFVVRGSGTADDPYRVTWELLVSAQEVYRPRAGQKKLPRRVTFLHNKHVRIAGFVAFPIASNNPRECLVMLNEWDGCCIGVMPTAFDAVEVRLGKAATADQRLAYHGEIRGKFKVDPFEDAGWLISLYLMEDGTLKADQ